MTESDSDTTTDSPGTQETRTLVVPERIVSKIERRLPNTRFETPDAYANFVLERLIAHVEELEQTEVGKGGDGQVENGSAETDDVRDRLESLGYIE